MEWFCQMLGPEVWAWLRYPVGLAAGLVVSLLIGHFAIKRFYDNQRLWLEGKWGPEIEPEEDNSAIKPSTVGRVERTIFTISMALYPTASLTAMGAWMVLKMATHWNRSSDEPPKEDPAKRSSYAMLGLLTGFLSMAFAALGGLAVRLIWQWQVGEWGSD